MEAAMRQLGFVSIFGLLVISTASATPVTVTFTNSSGDTIAAITATPKGGPAETTLNLLASAIASGELTDVQLDLIENQCVYDVVITFGSGTTDDRPDTDLCQTEGIVVE
jgi:hypothetical protein